MLEGLRRLKKKKKEPSGFSKIYLRFKKPILRYVKSRIADEEVAEEVVQEVFLKAFRFRKQYKKKFAFSTWLWTIARNTVSDHLRGTKGSIGPRHWNSDPGISLDEIPSPHFSAETIIIKKDERRHFLRMMKSLTRLQKKVLWMRIIHQLSYDEISKKLGLSLASVKNLAYRAKQTLSENLNLNHMMA